MERAIFYHTTEADQTQGSGLRRPCFFWHGFACEFSSNSFVGHSTLDLIDAGRRLSMKIAVSFFFMSPDPGETTQNLESPEQRISRRYATAQTTILILFAAVDFFGPKVYLFVAPPVVALLGNLLCGIGLGIMLVAIFFLRDTIQIAPEPKAGRKLVETGIYKYFRHPIYTGIIFCAAGLFLRKPTVWMVIAAIIVIGFLSIKVRFEEKLLQAAYPDYAAYRTRAWGLFPGLWY